ncbi:MAG: hypothetical protein WC683_17370 [bacterium]
MANDRPVQEWYPRARVTLLVRFEEFAETISAKPPGLRQTLRKGGTDTKELEYVLDPDAPAGSRRYILLPKGGSKIAAASADKFTHQLWGIIPVSANFVRNGIDKADTLGVELPFLDAPFDPRCIRSCAIDYYLGTITAEEAAAEAGAAVPTMIPDSTVDERGNVRSNRRLRGWVDTWEVNFSDSGTPMVKLECRDGRSVLIDQQSPPQLHVDPKLTLDKAVANYLSNFPQFAGVGVEWRGDGDAPKLSGILKNKGQDKGSKTGSDKSSVMDYLTDVVGSAGCVLLMEENALIISKPRTVLKAGATRANDPHTGAGRSINGMPLPNRTFVWGHNVRTMKFGRKLNAAAPVNIEVAAYLPGKKQTISVRFPGVTTQAAPGGAADKKIMVWRVQGITNKDDLKVIAQSVYEQSARQELSVEVTTTDMASFGGDNYDPDILDMLPGDSFDAYLMREAQGHTTVGLYEDSTIQKTKIVQMLVEMGHDEAMSKAYADSYMAGGFQTTFRTRALKLDWSIDSGVSISLTGSNYVEVRLDKEIT